MKNFEINPNYYALVNASDLSKKTIEPLKSANNKNNKYIAQKLFPPKENSQNKIESEFFGFICIKSLGSYWAPKFEKFDLNGDGNLALDEILDESNMANIDVGILFGLLMQNNIEKDTAIFELLNKFPIERKGEMLYAIFPDKFRAPFILKYAEVYPKEFYDAFESTKRFEAREFLCKSAIISPLEGQDPFISIYVLHPAVVSKFKPYDTNNDGRLSADELAKIPDDNSIGSLFQAYFQSGGGWTGYDEIIYKILNALPANRRSNILWWINDNKIGEYVIVEYAYCYPSEFWKGYKNTYDPDVKKYIAKSIIIARQAQFNKTKSSQEEDSFSWSATIDEKKLHHSDILKITDDTKVALLLEKLILKNKASLLTICKILNKFPANRRGAILTQIPNELIKTFVLIGSVNSFDFYKTYENSADESVKESLLKSLIFNSNIDAAQISAQTEKLIPCWSVSIGDLRDSEKDNLYAVDENNDGQLNAREITKITDDKTVSTLFWDIIKEAGMSFLTFDILYKTLNKFSPERRLAILCFMADKEKEIGIIFISMYTSVYSEEFNTARENAPEDVKKHLFEIMVDCFKPADPSPEYQYEPIPPPPIEMGIFEQLVKKWQINCDNIKQINDIMKQVNCELSFTPAEGNNVALGYSYEKNGYIVRVYYIFKTGDYTACRESKESDSQPIWQSANAKEIKLLHSKLKNDYKKLGPIIQQYR